MRASNLIATSASPLHRGISRQLLFGFAIMTFVYVTSLILLVDSAQGKCFVGDTLQNEELQEQQDGEKQQAEQNQQPDGEASDADTPADDKEAAENSTDVIDTAEQPEPPKVEDEQVKLHMWDGSIVGGKVSVTSINVETEFGLMTVPIKRIVAFYPGLDSFPEKQQQLKQLVEELGDGSYQVREDAHKELLKMGLPLREEIALFSDGGSIERKKHLAEIIKELDELLDELEDEDEPTQVRELVRKDRIVTPDMTVVGKIQQDVFYVTSKFGPLEVRLNDIEHASRDMKLAKAEVRKKVELTSKNFYQRKPKSTGIRVNKGDKISIRADGVMQWTNWSKTSTPEGLPSQGNWKSISSGTLVACVGKDEKNVKKVGSKEEWVAKKSGVLYLAIAIADNYVNNNGYRWTGEYKAKVVVTPASE